MGLTLTVAAGAVNMVLDYLFMGPLGMGLQVPHWRQGSVSVYRR